MKCLKKLRSRSGFSLAETLMAVMILLLVTQIVATGVPVAKNAYEKVVLGANARAMLSTAVTALRDELGTAWKIPPGGDGKSLTYFKSDTGAKAIIKIDAGEEPAILIADFQEEDFIRPKDDKTQIGKDRRLVPDNNAKMFVTYDKITSKENVVEIENLKVCRKGARKTPIAVLEKLDIRRLIKETSTLTGEG